MEWIDWPVWIGPGEVQPARMESGGKIGGRNGGRTDVSPCYPDVSDSPAAPEPEGEKRESADT